MKNLITDTKGNKKPRPCKCVVQSMHPKIDFNYLTPFNFIISNKIMSMVWIFTHEITNRWP